MKILVLNTIIFGCLIIAGSQFELQAQSSKGWPKYCDTEVGLLGPYDNNSVPEGGACYGTKNGKRYEGKASYGPDK